MIRCFIVSVGSRPVDQSFIRVYIYTTDL